jgi:hypothetical protein
VLPEDTRGATLGIDNIVWLVSGAIVALSPVFVFISYVLRIVTVAKETLAMGPFVFQRDTQQE